MGCHICPQCGRPKDCNDELCALCELDINAGGKADTIVSEVDRREQMAEAVNLRSPIKVIIHASHRNGICVECFTQMEVKDVSIGEGKLGKRPVCPKCGGMIGQLIARPTSIQAPDPPQCIRFKCLWKFVIDSLFVAYLSFYHRRRVAYAERNRPEKGKNILDKYRTGEPSPKTLWQAILANIKLIHK